MLGFPAPRLVKISTPYMRSGVLWDDFRKGWGQDNPDLLVWKAATATMNPSIRPASLERERRLDPDRFAREYEADFTEDLETFLPGAWIDAAITPGRHELPPQEGVRYEAAVDPSGGGQDAFTLAIAHAEGTGPDRRIVQDVMRGWTSRRSETTDLEGVVREIAGIVKRYGLSTVVGDRYAAGWVRERFQTDGIRYRDPEADTAQVYLEVEPLFAQGRIELLDHPMLAREFKQLERRPRPGGRTLVDHPRGGHDDHANALAWRWWPRCEPVRCRPAWSSASVGGPRPSRPFPEDRRSSGSTGCGRRCARAGRSDPRRQQRREPSLAARGASTTHQSPHISDWSGHHLAVAVGSLRRSDRPATGPHHLENSLITRAFALRTSTRITGTHYGEDVGLPAIWPQTSLSSRANERRRRRPHGLKTRGQTRFCGARSAKNHQLSVRGGCEPGREVSPVALSSSFTSARSAIGR